MNKSSFGQRVFEFYSQLEIGSLLPDKIQVMNPHRKPEVTAYVKEFLRKYFSDNNQRVLIFGINPGRFGAGLTGITFTDPVALKEHLGIDNNLQQKKELSAEFVYRFIHQWGGPKKFYGHFFLTAVSPLGFTKNGINFNYYDDPELLKSVRPFIIRSIQKQIELGGSSETAILLGSGKNLKEFNKLNQEYKFFNKVYALDHPRFIMQYKRKAISKYLNRYWNTFSSVIG